MTLGVASLALIVTPAYSATITTYSSETAWAAASSGDQVSNFAGLAPTGGAQTYATSAGVTSNGVQFIGYTATPGSYYIEVIDTTAAWDPYYNFGDGDALVMPMNGSSLPYIQISLPTPVTAFGMDLFTTNPSAVNYTITVAGTPYTVATNPSSPTPPSTPAFWGVTSDTGISTITLTLQDSIYGNNSTALLGDFQYGTATVQQMGEAPEAATFLLIGSGLIGIIALKKRIKGDRQS